MSGLPSTVAALAGTPGGLATAFASGAVAGLAIAVPVGAVSTLIVMVAAQRGWRVGAAAGLGAATVDGAYATVALVAGAALAPLIEAYRTTLRWSSAVVLAAVAVVLARPAWRPAGAAPSTTAEQRSALGPARAYLTVLGLTAVNPATVVYFAALVAGPAARTVTNPPQRTAFVVGALLGSACWQLLLAGTGSAVGGVLTGPRARRWTATAGALAVGALAVATAVGG
ncbi:MAG: hypothetical protein BGO38_07795 [Cellulomonas sp. 73-145]|uniref:LysE family transporter n=1 Tax=Cellulomonas sp. 73-145 TaxID=1895739 RepID=UPI000928EAD3|nr:LysE family transporter [Cellulomonas sp. 73-145]MBN9326033.1 LysE family transporter [Cellulomonas sp.]OJV58095.1 MAG: hypothetical protein BGO38_07795 [Cellulomonas sp. 73-145]